jgi:hypothetical protein
MLTSNRDQRSQRRAYPVVGAFASSFYLFREKKRQSSNPAIRADAAFVSRSVRILRTDDCMTNPRQGRTDRIEECLWFGLQIGYSKSLVNRYHNDKLPVNRRFPACVRKRTVRFAWLGPIRTPVTAFQIEIIKMSNIC